MSNITLNSEECQSILKKLEYSFKKKTLEKVSSVKPSEWDEQTKIVNKLLEGANGV